MDEAGILSELLPELNRILKFSISKLYFLKHRLLSLQNVQDLEKTNSQADLTTKLVALLVQGTRKPAQKMAEVLSDMVKNNDGSEALEDLIEQIQFKLKSAAAVVRTGGPVTRSRTPAEPNLLGWCNNAYLCSCLSVASLTKYALLGRPQNALLFFPS